MIDNCKGIPYNLHKKMAKHNFSVIMMAASNILGMNSYFDDVEI